MGKNVKKLVSLVTRKIRMKRELENLWYMNENKWMEIKIQVNGKKGSIIFSLKMLKVEEN